MASRRPAARTPHPPGPSYTMPPARPTTVLSARDQGQRARTISVTNGYVLEVVQRPGSEAAKNPSLPLSLPPSSPTMPTIAASSVLRHARVPFFLVALLCAAVLLPVEAKRARARTTPNRQTAVRDPTTRPHSSVAARPQRAPPAQAQLPSASVPHAMQCAAVSPRAKVTRRARSRGGPRRVGQGAQGRPALLTHPCALPALAVAGPGDASQEARLRTQHVLAPHGREPHELPVQVHLRAVLSRNIWP